MGKAIFNALDVLVVDVFEATKRGWGGVGL